MLKKCLYAKTLTLILLVVSLFFVAAIPINMVKAQGATVGLDPHTIVDNTLVSGETFEVNVTITDVTDLYEYEFELDWFPFSLLSTTVANVTEGEFLKSGGSTNFYAEIVEDFGVLLANTLVGATSGVNGSGILATVKFRVEERGYAYFEFYDADYVGLLDHLGGTIPTAWGDGGFRNVENIYVEPLTTVKNPPDVFSVDLKVANVTDVYGWGLTLKWKIGLITYVTATEGGFLAAGGSTFWVPPVVSLADDYVILGCTLIGADVGVSGSGTLATVSLKVQEGGDSVLELTDTALVDSHADLISHTWQDGYFHTTKPAASFKWSPINPTKGETVTFNATACYDPDGGTITSYTWDFDDGTGTFTESDPFINHTFSENDRYYYVKLNVTDDDVPAEWWEIQKTLRTVLRDVAVIDVTTSPYPEAKAGTNVLVNATVENNGGILETFNVTVYYDSNIIDEQSVINLDPGTNRTLTFVWNTTGVPLGKYNITAVADIVSPLENDTANNEGSVVLSISQVSTYLRQVEIGGVTFVYVIKSNSTVTSIAFNQTAKEISFNATAKTGTVGFFNVTIPMGLLNASSPNDWTVKFDGNTVVPTIKKNSTHYFIYHNYTHSTHKIQIIGTSVATAPIASFTSVNWAYTYQTITFNATYDPATGIGSYDPDGTITKYDWNFGDGTTANETVPITTHKYLSAAKYKVILTVTDNQGFKASFSKQVGVSRYIDISVLNVTVSQNTVKYGESLDINVTVKNEGAHAETFNVTVYYDSSIIDEQTVTLSVGATKTLAFVWNTTGFSIGTYTIKATAEVPGDADTLDNTFVDGEVTIERLDSILTLEASQATINFGEKTDITGSITPPRADVIVDIRYKIAGGDWKKLRMATTNENGEYIYTWQPATAGTYELKASWMGDEVTKASESTTLNVTVNKLVSTLTIELSATSIDTGQTVTIGGQLLPLRVGVNVTIQVRSNGGDWDILETVITNEDGLYMYPWKPSQGGAYELKASWLGDVNTSPAESDTKTVDVQEPFSNLLLYGTVVAIVLAISILVYFLKFRKAKQIRKAGKS